LPKIQPRTEAALIEAEQNWAAALNRKDAAAVACLLADEFEDADVDGSLHTRSQTLDQIPNKKPGTNQLSELRAHIEGNIGFTRGLAYTRGPIRQGRGPRPLHRHLHLPRWPLAGACRTRIAARRSQSLDARRSAAREPRQSYITTAMNGVGDGEVTGEIGLGLLVLLGVGAGDTRAEADYLVEKIIGLRIFEDADGKMNLSIAEVGGALLVVSAVYALWRCAPRVSGHRSTRPLRPSMPVSSMNTLLRKSVAAGLRLRNRPFPTNDAGRTLERRACDHPARFGENILTLLIHPRSSWPFAKRPQLV